MSGVISLHISLDKQRLTVLKNGSAFKSYLVSTGEKGAGEIKNSGQTPRGKHLIRAKIGNNCPIYTVFVGRRPTGERYSQALKDQYPNRDWILTRILWLSGMEIGLNRLGNVDTMQRYIYIHGTPDDQPLGIPASKGCIRMTSQDILELFELVPYRAQLTIE